VILSFVKNIWRGRALCAGALSSHRIYIYHVYKHLYQIFHTFRLSCFPSFIHKKLY
jgi:hypothetical protein